MTLQTSASGRLWLRFVIFAAVLAGLFVAARTVPLVPRLDWLQDRLDELGPFGPLIFIAAYMVAAVLFVPDTVLKMAAGALFGLFWGIVLGSLAATAGAAIAFLIGRYMARGLISRQTNRFPKFAAVDRAIGRKGWKVVALLRLVPIFPYNVGNYAFGLTSIRFWPYVLATWLAMLPGGFVLVYFGHVGRITLESAARGEAILEPTNLALLVSGLLLAAAVTWYIARLAHNAIEQHVREEEAIGE